MINSAKHVSNTECADPCPFLWTGQSNTSCFRCGSSFHSVPASSLGGIQGFVGGTQECLAIARLLFILLGGGQSEAESNWKQACTGLDRNIGNATAQPLRPDH